MQSKPVFAPQSASQPDAMSTAFPHSLEPLEAATQAEVEKRFLGCRFGLVRVKETGFLMPAHYAKYAEKYYNFRFLEDDVVVMTHPKCGTTWMQEIVWTMRSGLDFDTPLELGVRSPFLEFDSLENPELEPLEEWAEEFRARNPGKDPKEEGLYLFLADSSPSPRTIKTHLPFSLLNPSLLDTSKGPYWKHVAEGWEKRDHPNVLFIFYEDLKEDIMREMRRLNAFLGTGYTDEQLLKVAEHTKFSNMKSRSTTNPTEAAVKVGRFKAGEGEFVRKGMTGGWASYFTTELEEKFEQWVEKWKDVASEIPFKYEINKKA
ncbi:estrogen sulfotransferase [Penaeus vannamei]|uniref:Estrogen sulfotransferase n=1 Tax=Penaeus vannamei TaxID=6689 RepID=A0A3R7QA48_PENVA|nr:estrogen sulfotransferase [Penaeus vannamei]